MTLWHWRQKESNSANRDRDAGRSRPLVPPLPKEPLRGSLPPQPRFLFSPVGRSVRKQLVTSEEREPRLRPRMPVVLDRAYRTSLKKLTVGRVTVAAFALSFLLARAYVSFSCSPPAPEKRATPPEDAPPRRPTYVLHGDRVDSGYLRHVIAVLERLGWRRVRNDSDFDLLWSHVYPFGDLAPFPKTFLQNLPPYKKVNHFPGSGHFTNKVDLAVSDLKYVPKAFHLPSQKVRLLKYSRAHPDRMFVQKSNSHRGIKILKVDDMDLNSTGTFVQEYVPNPFLIDGYKFDVGVYAVLTSVDPLRVYVYNGDVLLRFCAKKYEPFDPEDVDKYVVGDDYTPIWKIPSLEKFYSQRKLSMKETLNAYIRKIGKTPAKVWNQIESSIVNVFLEKEEKLIGITKRYRNVGNFFEMVRFDYILDADLNVYLMETNMSPNLSSDHFPPNRLLYENVLFGLFALVGVGGRTVFSPASPRSTDEEQMEAPEKGLAVFGDECAGDGCDGCGAPHCALCHHCLTPRARSTLRQAYLEFVNRVDYKRVFPPKMDPNTKPEDFDVENYSPENRFMLLWFLGKCRQDESWC